MKIGSLDLVTSFLLFGNFVCFVVVDIV